MMMQHLGVTCESWGAVFGQWSASALVATIMEAFIIHPASRYFEAWLAGEDAEPDSPLARQLANADTRARAWHAVQSHVRSEFSFVSAPSLSLLIREEWPGASVFRDEHRTPFHSPRFTRSLSMM